MADLFDVHMPRQRAKTVPAHQWSEAEQIAWADKVEQRWQQKHRVVDELEADVLQKVRDIRVDRIARRRLDAEGWTRPVDTGSLADQLALPEEPLKWHIDRLAFVGANVLLNAQAKSGKTNLLLNVARALLSGDALFGEFAVQRIAEGRSVAWWNAEVSHQQATGWLRDVSFDRPDDFYPLHLRGLDMPFDLEHVENWAVEWLSARGVQVWILDPLSALFTGEENSNTEAGAWLRALDRIKRRADVDTAFVVHHTAESTADAEDPGGRRLLKGRGASRLMGWADVLWSYEGRFAEPRYLSALGRDVDVEPFGGLRMLSDDRRLVWDGRRSNPATDRQENLALAVFEAVAEHVRTTGEPMNAGQLQSALPGRKADPKRRATELAIARGWITVEDGPRKSRLHRPGEVNPHRVRLPKTASANQ